MNAIAMIHDGRRDFDFLHGDWQVRHRLLKRRGAASTSGRSSTGRVTAAR